MHTINKDVNLTDNKTYKIDDILKEKLENVFHKKTSQVMLNEIEVIARENRAIDLAYAAIHLPLYARPILYDNLPNFDSKIKFIINTSSDTRLIIFRYMREIDMKQLIEKMPSDEAVYVLDDMSERRFRRVMEVISSKKAKIIQNQKKHHRNSAGRLMTNEFLSFNINKTINDISDYIHDHPRIDITKGIFITDDENKLQGYIPARNIIVNPKTTSLKKVMRLINHSAFVETTREEIIDLFERYKLSSIPVIDENNKILGIISNDDVLEAMEDLADKRMANIAGTIEDVSAPEPIIKRFLKRAPWLIVTLIAGLINVSIISSFQKMEGFFLTFVLFFVPLITGMSGNIGIQCSTVLVRSFAVGSFSKQNRWDSIFKELLTGIFTGIVFGIICGFLIYGIDHFTNLGLGVNSIALGTIIGLGLIGACFAGTFLGVFSPLFFESIGIDPAISSGPIVTAFNDVLSMSIYFLISYLLSFLFF
ncbi:MAG: Magnesium transporter MgtE [Candidatus Anoxychlamydiales bacterium]|nr:Magnesium transporter MgtE [Candidatus Anoxychlamydiales bacterium]